MVFKFAMVFDNGWSSRGRQQMMEPWYLKWPRLSSMVGAVAAASRWWINGIWSGHGIQQLLEQSQPPAGDEAMAFEENHGF
jgi:hypothetical protein